MYLDKEFTLHEIVDDPFLEEIMQAVAQQNLCQENLEFYKSVIDYEELDDEGERCMYPMTVS